MLSDERFEMVVKEKCSKCFRKDAVVDGCLLFKERHAGIELCLGPFNDQDDRTQKIRQDF